MRVNKSFSILSIMFFSFLFNQCNQERSTISSHSTQPQNQEITRENSLEEKVSNYGSEFDDRLGQLVETNNVNELKWIGFGRAQKESSEFNLVSTHHENQFCTNFLEDLQHQVLESLLISAEKQNIHFSDYKQKESLGADQAYLSGSWQELNGFLRLKLAVWSPKKTKGLVLLDHATDIDYDMIYPIYPSCQFKSYPEPTAYQKPESTQPTEVRAIAATGTQDKPTVTKVIHSSKKKQPFEEPHCKEGDIEVVTLDGHVKKCPSVVTPPTEKKQSFNCTKEYKPVCGYPKFVCPFGLFCATVMPEAQTYSNSCMMNLEEAQFVHEGECEVNFPISAEPAKKVKQPIKQPLKIPTEVPSELPAHHCTQEYDPVCGQPKFTCMPGPNCAFVMPPPQIYGNICLMSQVEATLLDYEECQISSDEETIFEDTVSKEENKDSFFNITF